MRVLALTSWWPEPADNGIRLRLSRLLRALTAEHELHLMTLCADAPPGPGARPPAGCATAEAMQLSVAPAEGTAGPLDLLSLRPASVRTSWSGPFAALVRRRAAELRPDAVIAFELAMAPYALCVPGAPRLLDDLELAALHDAYADSSGPQRLRRGLTWQKQRLYVRRMLRGFAACTVVSAREADLARPLAPAGMALALVPNGADVAPAPPAVAPEPATLIYPGALSYAANLDAMRYFLHAIFPLVRAARPETRLRITGNASGAQIAALPRVEGVEFTGFVPDIQGLVARSWAEVVPLREGSGTRLKILEALAVGTPVVSTSKGCEGLELRGGQDLLVADDPAAFAAATLELLAQPELRARLAAQGHRAVLQRYDWRAIGAQLAQLLEKIALQGSVRYATHG